MQEPPYPKDAGSRRKVVPASNTFAADEDQEEAEESNITAAQEETVEPPRTSQEFHDNATLPFPERLRKPVAEEQFGKFVKVIQKLYVNIPHLDAMQVLVFLILNRIWIPQAHRITAVALHLGVFQGIVIFLREALWIKSIEESNDNFTNYIN